MAALVSALREGVMRTLFRLWSRSAEIHVSIPQRLRKRQHIPRAALAAGVTTFAVATCVAAYAQVSGMPNSPGRQPTQSSPAAQDAQTKVTVQRSKAKVTVQRTQAKPAVQRAQAKPTPPRAESAAKPMPPRTIGAHTPDKAANPAAAKTPMPVPAPAKAAMAIPAAELLAAPSQPNCAFDSARTDADDRQKLDYERQCYRHAEMIMRARLERLQGEIGPLIKAAKGGEGLSASR
jgi:hypothetical protein